jgi:hypothetical protein
VRTAVVTRLPEVVIVGAMKCGTSALHRYLDDHPDIAMSSPKELNFFFGRDDPADCGSEEQHDWHGGSWRLGVDWYASRFDPTAPVRGEASPGYTSPSHPEVAGRMAALLPEARLLYLVRDPLARAVSQYHHHHREGSERRPLGEALLDPASQYVARSRYHERLAPFLAHYPAGQIAIVAQEELRAHRRSTLRTVYEFVGVDAGHWSEASTREWHIGGRPSEHVSPDVVERFHAEVRDDADRLRELAGRDLPGWSC